MMDRAGSPSSIAAQCSPSRSPSPLFVATPDDASVPIPDAGASDAQLREHAAKLRISLSPPPAVHVPPGPDPKDIANIAPPPEEPRPVVHGAAAGEGEAGGVSRDVVEAEPGSGDSRPGDVKEDGPGPGTGGRDDHCGAHEGIGVGMPKTDQPKMARQHDATEPSSKNAKKDGSSGGSSGDPSSSRASGSGAGYGADASASSSAEKSRSVEDSSRSRSMAPEPEVTPKSPKQSSRDAPTARRPRRPPGKDEQGGNMLPPSGRGEHRAPAPPDATAAPQAGPSSGGSDGHAQRYQNVRESSSAGNELDQRFHRLPPHHHPHSSHHHYHSPQNPSHQSSGVEMRDSTGAYVSVARAPGRQVLGPGFEGVLQHPTMGERWGNVGEQNREVVAAMPRDGGPDHAAAQRETSGTNQDDTSGTEGWFQTLNYHYRPPGQTKGTGEDQVRTSPEDHSGGDTEAESRLSPRAILGCRAQQDLDEGAEPGRLSSAGEEWQRRRGSGDALRVQAVRNDAERRRGSRDVWVGRDQSTDRAKKASEEGEVGGRAEASAEAPLMRRGASSKLNSGALGMGRSLSVQSKREVESGEIIDGMDLDGDDEDVTFREIVDDLTVQNKLLKSRLRRYEPAKQPKGIKKERLFEVRFFEGMPADRRRELEGFLTAFVQTLHDPNGEGEDSAERSVSRSMPSISAIHNSTGDERLNSSGGEASDPRERPAQPARGDGPHQGSTGSEPQQPVIRQVEKPHDSGYGSRASFSGNSAQKGAHAISAAPTAPGSTTTGNGTSNQQRSTTGAAPASNSAQPGPRTSREKPRRSEQDRLAAPSFSGFEPPSATGTGSGMKVSPPLEGTMDWDEPPKPERKRTDFDQKHGTDASTVEKAKAVAAAVEKLFSQSALIARGDVGGAASGDTDPMPLPDHAGTNQAYLRNLLEASGSKGWIYLNLAFGMAQLHRFHVAMPFVQDALRTFAPTVDVSPDGKKVRRRPGVDSAADPASSDGQGINGSTGNVSSVRNDTSTTGKSSGTTGQRATTGSRPTEGSTAQTSMEPSKAGSKSDPAGGEGSFSSVPIIKEPDYRLVIEKETPAFKRVKTSEALAPTSGAEGKAGLSDGSTRGGVGGTSAYVPLFNHGTDGDSDEGSPFDLSSFVYSDAMNETQRRDAGEGTLSFFAGGKFYSDLSAEPPTTVGRAGSRAAEAYTVGLKGDDVEDKTAVPSEFSKLESTFLRRSDPAFERALAKLGVVDPADQGEEAVLSFEVGHMDETERATIQLEALVATGMTNLNISDNFSLIVTLAYIRAEGRLAGRKRKYSAIDLSPAADLEKLVRSRLGETTTTTPSDHHFGYRPIYERPISHLPSSRPRLLSQAFTAVSDGSDDDEYDSEAPSGSGPRDSIESDEAPDGDEAPRRRLASSPGGDYNLSLQYPFIWSRSAAWDPSQDSHSSGGERGTPALVGHGGGGGGGGGGRRRRFDDGDGDEPMAKRRRWGTSALATPSAVEEEYTPMDVEPDAYVD